MTGRHVRICPSIRSTCDRTSPCHTTGYLLPVRLLVLRVSVLPQEKSQLHKIPLSPFPSLLFVAVSFPPLLFHCIFFPFLSVSPFPFPSFLFPFLSSPRNPTRRSGGALLAPPAGSGAWHLIAVNVTLHERTARSAQIRTTELRILCRTALSLRQTAVHRAPVRATPNYDSSNTLFILNRFLTLFSLSGTPAN